MMICNLAVLGNDQNSAANPRDGKLDIHIRVPQRTGIFQKKIGATNLPVASALLESSKMMNVVCDGEVVQGKSFSLSVDPASLKIITGKDRCF